MLKPQDNLISGTNWCLWKSIYMLPSFFSFFFFFLYSSTFSDSQCEAVLTLNVETHVHLRSNLSDQGFSEVEVDPSLITGRLSCTKP